MNRAISCRQAAATVASVSELALNGAMIGGGLGAADSLGLEAVAKLAEKRPEDGSK